MRPKFILLIASPPDREYLVVEIRLDRDHFGELNREQEVPVLELYPRPDGEPWRVSAKELMEALTEANSEIMSHSRPSHET